MKIVTDEIQHIQRTFEFAELSQNSSIALADRIARSHLYTQPSLETLILAHLHINLQPQVCQPQVSQPAEKPQSNPNRRTSFFAAQSAPPQTNTPPPGSPLYVV